MRRYETTSGDLIVYYSRVQNYDKSGTYKVTTHIGGHTASREVDSMATIAKEATSNQWLVFTFNNTLRRM